MNRHFGQLLDNAASRFLSADIAKEDTILLPAWCW